MTMIPIHIVDGHGLIFDIEHVKYLREQHSISGILIGILPQVPQQNVFMGLPLQLMPEEVKYLVESGYAFTVDDKSMHNLIARDITSEDGEQFRAQRKQDQEDQVQRHKEEAWEKRQKALEKMCKKKGIPFEPEGEEKKASVLASMSSVDGGVSIEIPSTSTRLPGYNKLIEKQSGQGQGLPTNCLYDQPEKAAYQMYKHLHEKGYFLMPGLRFGGQFLAYPGDPLRYHSHHIAIGFDWDEEFSILDIVGGGRLGTTVKKCWLVGAKDESKPEDEYECFSIEWSGFG